MAHGACRRQTERICIAFIIIQIITALVNGTAELSRCLILCTWMAVFWVLPNSAKLKHPPLYKTA